MDKFYREEPYLKSIFMPEKVKEFDEKSIYKCSGPTCFRKFYSGIVFI